MTQVSNLREAVLHAWQLSDPIEKCTATQQLWHDFNANTDCSELQSIGLTSTQPGRPAQPELVEPRYLKRRRLGSVEGRAALLHAIAHIEFNAINLALDAALRFTGMPKEFYIDWLSVAADEARHFQLLADRLKALDCRYGDHTAHNGLWEMAQKTHHDVLIRMALVPRVLEARGLDVTPGMIEKLQSVGDAESVAVLKVILSEEVRHVEIGTRWFRYCCGLRGLEPDSTFVTLLGTYFAGGIRPPLNEQARLAADFSANEMVLLKEMANA